MNKDNFEGTVRSAVGQGEKDRAFKELVRSIVQSATKVFRERAEAKRRELVDVAQSQVATVATMLFDEIGKKLENVIDRLPGGINVRRLIEYRQFRLR